jgi:4-oxalocrotonate tautomerase
MPFIKLEAGKMDNDQKEKLMSGFTKLASETLGIPEQAFHVICVRLEIEEAGLKLVLRFESFSPPFLLWQQKRLHLPRDKTKYFMGMLPHGFELIVFPYPYEFRRFQLTLLLRMQ